MNVYDGVNFRLAHVKVHTRNIKGKKVDKISRGRNLKGRFRVYILFRTNFHIGFFHFGKYTHYFVLYFSTYFTGAITNPRKTNPRQTNTIHNER